MEDRMLRLVERLRELDASDLPDAEEDVFCRDEVVEVLACQTLIDDEGHPRYPSMDELWKTHGYFVFPVERDRFGWVLAAIRTKKGSIVFG